MQTVIERSTEIGWNVIRKPDLQNLSAIPSGYGLIGGETHVESPAHRSALKGLLDTPQARPGPVLM